MSGALFLACRVSDLETPYVPSTRRCCERCRAEVWVDPGALAAAIHDLGSEPLVLCVPCADTLTRSARHRHQESPV